MTVQKLSQRRGSSARFSVKLELELEDRMKTFLLVIATFSLVSCIPVDDFGAYWGKAGIDGRPTRRMALLCLAPQMRIVENNGTYEVTSYANATKLDGGSFAAKTLRTGRHPFLAVRLPSRKSGFVERYQIKGRVLQLCEEDIDEFVSTNYPQAVNMKNPGDVGDVMSIALFDAEVFTILSKIPDTQDARSQILYRYCYRASERASYGERLAPHRRDAIHFLGPGRSTTITRAILPTSSGRCNTNSTSLRSFRSPRTSPPQPTPRLRPRFFLIAVIRLHKRDSC